MYTYQYASMELRGAGVVTNTLIHAHRLVCIAKINCMCGRAKSWRGNQQRLSSAPHKTFLRSRRAALARTCHKNCPDVDKLGRIAIEHATICTFGYGPLVPDSARFACKQLQNI